MARSLTAARLPVGGQIQQAAERLERNFVDSRQLKVCATCFDLSVSLLRVLEMTITLVPEIFLDWAQPTSEMLLRRLAQLLNQVLNRVTAERNLFDRVVTLRLPGEDLGTYAQHTAGRGLCWEQWHLSASTPGRLACGKEGRWPPPVGAVGGSSPPSSPQA